MWFAFPAGAERVTIERQEFVAEAKDNLGRACFRAPAHFAPRLLAITGFALAGEIDANAPEDVAEGSGTKEEALVALTKELEAQDLEIKGLREDHIAATAKLAALTAERDAALKALEEAKAKIAELEEELDDKPVSKAGAKG